MTNKIAVAALSALLASASAAGAQDYQYPSPDQSGVYQSPNGFGQPSYSYQGPPPTYYQPPPQIYVAPPAYIAPPLYVQPNYSSGDLRWEEHRRREELEHENRERWREQRPDAFHGHDGMHQGGCDQSGRNCQR